MARYLIQNGAMPTTAAQVAVTTGNTIKTMLQVKPGTTQGVHIVEWGCSYDGSAAATPGKVELIQTDVAATVTAAAAADIHKYDAAALMGGDPTTSIFAVGTTSTGYTATAEGTITAIRFLDGAKFIAPTNQYEKQFPLGERPFVEASKFARIRVTFGTAVNMYCYMIIEV